MNLSESLVKYLAGLLDADGCLSLDPHRGYDDKVRLSIKMTLVAADTIDHHGFVSSLPELTGFGAVSRNQDKYSCWSVCHRNELEMLLPRVIKHMVVKAKHWQWILDFWRSWRSQEKGQKCMTEAEWEVLYAKYKASRIENVGPVHPKNHPTWAWLAGYLDGDGCFSFRTSKNNNMRLSVTAHVMDVTVLEFLQKSFGGTILENSRGNHLKVWWRGLGPSHASFAMRFLPKLVKHLRFKKHKVEQMIHFHRQRLSVSRAAAHATV